MEKILLELYREIYPDTKIEDLQKTIGFSKITHFLLKHIAECKKEILDLKNKELKNI